MVAWIWNISLPGEWYKCHTGAVVAAEKGAGSIAETWGDVLCVCGGWQWLSCAWTHSQVACNVHQVPPVDSSSEPLLG